LVRSPVAGLVPDFDAATDDGELTALVGARVDQLIAEPRSDKRHSRSTGVPPHDPEGKA
jgi:hypothetical protein